MAQLKWGGKISPMAYIVAETPEEENFIRQYPDKKITRTVYEGKVAFVLSATLPLDYLLNLQKEVSLSSHNTLFPGRTLSIPRIGETV